MSSAVRSDEPRHRSVINKDWLALNDLYARDAVLETPDAGTISGREAIVAWFQGFGEAFPDVSHELVHQYESGDTAIDEGYLVGTNTGPLTTPTGVGIPATGKALRLPSCDVATVEGGLVTRHRFYFDQMDFMSQLGLAPEE